MALAVIDAIIYEPDFDPDGDTYRDKSPFAHRSRNNLRYECRCQAGSYFSTNSQFSTHIKKKAHQTYLRNYTHYHKDADDSRREKRDLKAENEKVKQKLRKAEREIRDLTVENEKLKRKLRKAIGLVELRDQEIAFLHGIEDPKEPSDDDEFVDCN